MDDKDKNETVDQSLETVDQSGETEIQPRDTVEQSDEIVDQSGGTGDLPSGLVVVSRRQSYMPWRSASRFGINSMLRPQGTGRPKSS